MKRELVNHVSHRDPSSPLTVFPSVPLPLRYAASSPEIAHQIHSELPVRSSIRSCERLHDLLVVVHDLLLFPRQVRLPLLTIKHLRLGPAITEMLDRPPFVRRAVNSTRGGSFNTVFA